MRKRRSQEESGKFRKALKVSATALSLGILITGLVYVWESGFFELKETVFLGNSYLSDKELKAMIGEKGASLFTPLGSIAGKLDASPWIKDVKLRKEYPRLVIKIKEAVPVAFIQKQTGYFLISDEGLMLERLEGAVPFLPVIVSDLDGGEAFQEAVSLARVLKDTGIPSEMERVEISGLEKGAENLSLSLDGVPVKVGKGQYEEKLLRLLELSDEIKKREISVDFIDLRFADRVVVKAIPEALK